MELDFNMIDIASTSSCMDGWLARGVTSYKKTKQENIHTQTKKEKMSISYTTCTSMFYWQQVVWYVLIAFT